MFDWLFKLFKARPEIEYKLLKYRVITHDLHGTLEEIDITKIQFEEFKKKLMEENEHGNI